MASQCTTQAPPSITVCSQNCNKCVAGNTSRMLYNTLVKKLDDRDREQQTPVLASLFHESEKLSQQDVEKTRLNPIPDPIPKRRKPIEPPETASTTTTTTTYRSNDNFAPTPPFTERKYYCYSKMQINNRKCCNECRLVIKETNEGAWSLY